MKLLCFYLLQQLQGKNTTEKGTAHGKAFEYRRPGSSNSTLYLCFLGLIMISWSDYDFMFPFLREHTVLYSEKIMPSFKIILMSLVC